MGRWLPLAFLLTFVVLTLLIAGRPQLPMFGPSDHISSMVLGAGSIESDRAWDVLQADGVLQFQPWRKAVIESWARFEVPQWNPNQLMGTPLLANSQSAPFYPGHLLMGVLQVPWSFAMAILLVLHLVILSRGMFLLTISLGARPAAAFVAALALTFSPFMISWAALASVPTTICWIPITMWWLRRAVQGRGNPAWVGVGIACMMLGGHLQFASYGLLAVLVFGLGHLRLNLSRAALVAACGVAGALISLPQVLPALEFSKLSHRAGVATEAGYEAYRGSSLTARELPALIAPQVLGNPDKEITLEGLPSDVGSSWIAYLKRGGNFAESAFGLGFLLWGGILLIRKVKPMVLTGAGLMALSMLLITPSFVQRLAYFGMPGWSSTGSPGRAGVLFLIGGAILASGARIFWRPSIVIWGPLILIVMALALAGPAASPLESMLDYMWIVLSGLAALLVFNYRVGDRPRTTAFTLTVVTVLLALFMCVRSGLPSLTRSAINSTSGERVAWINDRWNLYTIPERALMPGNLSTLYGFTDVAGYDSLMSADTVKLLDDVNGGPSSPQENGNMLFIKSKADPAKLALLGVTRVFSREPFAGLPSEEIAGIFSTKLDGPGILTGGKLKTRTAGLITIEANGPVTFRERNLPGWSLLINGQKADLPTGVWLSAPTANPGDQIIFTYSTPGMRTGVNLAAFGILALLLGGIWHQRRGKVQE